MFVLSCVIMLAAVVLWGPLKLLMKLEKQTYILGLF